MNSLRHSAAVAPFHACAARFVLALLAGVGCAAAWGAEVGLAGVFPGKALLTIDGGAPRTVPVGARTAEGVLVVAVDRETATLDINGKQRILRVGQNVAAQNTASEQQSAVLTANGQGHFLTSGLINGATVRFLVDTGATMVALGASDARRVGLNAGQGEQVVVNTANGQALASRIKLESVRVGDIVVFNVDAMVHSTDMPYVLLGMSFLNRMEMQRNGDTMTLKKRF